MPMNLPVVGWGVTGGRDGLGAEVSIGGTVAPHPTTRVTRVTRETRRAMGPDGRRLAAIKPEA
jgi:hypothetical protein